MERMTISTAIEGPAAEVWERVVSLEGVNYELAPWIRMTVPRGMSGKTIADLEPGVRVGRSWLLLGGVLPVDYDDLCLAEIEPPRRFLERSTMATMAVWEHERTVEPLGAAACTVTDGLAFSLRAPLAAIPGSGGLARGIVGALFAHRHRRLVRAHGSAEPR